MGIYGCPERVKEDLDAGRIVRHQEILLLRRQREGREARTEIEFRSYTILDTLQARYRTGTAH